MTTSWCILYTKVETKNRVITEKWVAPFLLALLLILHTPAFGAKARNFSAVVMEYNVNANPQVSSRKFKSQVAVFGQDAVKIIEIKNFIMKRKEPDGIVRIVRSGMDVASVVYNDKMETLAEYPKGKIVSKNLYTFSQTSGKRTVHASWFIGEDYMMSDSYMTDEKGTLLYKETVIYSAKNR